jgi:hypothetical protein
MYHPSFASQAGGKAGGKTTFRRGLGLFAPGKQAKGGKGSTTFSVSAPQPFVVAGTAYGRIQGMDTPPALAGDTLLTWYYTVHGSGHGWSWKPVTGVPNRSFTRPDQAAVEAAYGQEKWAELKRAMQVYGNEKAAARVV